MSAQVASHLAAAHREADQRDITQIELRQKLIQILGESVVVIACRRLAGPAESPAVVCDDPMTRSKQGRGLLLPGSAAQRPTVDEYDGLTRAEVFVIEIDIAGIFLTNSNEWHWGFPFCERICGESVCTEETASFGITTPV